MKQVAGTLKLDLAQYRELAAFTQFGSDLDKATQAQLARGARLVEILKQPQYHPLLLSEQVIILFSGARGFLDKYEVEQLKGYEIQLSSFMKSKHPEIMTEIDDKKILSPELDKKMTDALTEFDSVFITE